MKKILILIIIYLVIVATSSCDDEMIDGLAPIEEETDLITEHVLVLEEIKGFDLEPVDPGDTLQLACYFYTSDHEEAVSIQWSADGGRFNNSNKKNVTWLAPDHPGFYNIRLMIQDEYGNTDSWEELIIVGVVEGLIFKHELVIEEDAGSNLQMRSTIRNVTEGKLPLFIHGTVYGNADDIKGPNDKLFEIVNYGSFAAQTLTGELLEYNRRVRRITPKEWYFFPYFNIDVVTLETGEESTVIVEYEIVSGESFWKGFGSKENLFKYDDIRDFWVGCLEWLVLRPESDIKIYRNTMDLVLPHGWNYATPYTSIGENTINLGQLRFMYWDNEKRWQNVQRSPIIFFNEGPFQLAEKSINGIKVQDVYSSTALNRNHDANYHYVKFMIDYFGELPIDGILTFYSRINGNAIDHFRAFQGAPYGFSYSMMGIYYQSGADIGGPEGRALSQPQYWDFYSIDDHQSFSFYMHGTIRSWLGTLIQGDPGIVRGGITTYIENIAVADYYQDWDVRNRFKPMYDFYKEEFLRNGREGPDKLGGFGGHSFYYYFKGALTFYYFDNLIKEVTNEERDLSYAAKYIHEAALKGETTDRVLVIKALNYAAEDKIDFTRKVDGYLFGNSVLNLDKYFADFEID